MDNTVTLPIKLTPREQRKLERVTMAYRAKKIVAEKCGVSRDTLYNAIAGKNIRADLADRIKTYLTTL